MRTVSIIGSGFSSLSAACFLAKEGYQVDVFEKNSSPGGRARVFNAEGFKFDMGPSWYWMPDVFENFFSNFGKKSSDYYDLIRLDPSYRVFFSENEIYDIPAGKNELFQLFEKLEPGSTPKLTKLLEEAAYKYRISMNDLVYKPGLSLGELIDTKIISGAFKLNLFKSISSYLRGYFKDPRLLSLLEFPVLFLGAMPEKTPALYSMMNYADISLGTWYPMGGMHKIVDAMVSLAKSMGVKFHFNSEITSIDVQHYHARQIRTSDETINTDCIVAGGDYHHIEQLLSERYRNYKEYYWEDRTMSPSSLIFYLGVDKKIKNLRHHNLFFDSSFKQHATEIYADPRWPADPLFYVCCPSKTDASVAPDGKENLFMLMPVAADLQDNDLTREKYFDLLIDRLEHLTGDDIRNYLVYKRSYAHNNFIEDYHAYKGNAYGMANTLNQTFILKPSMRNEKINNIFYTGQLTVPGPGVPPALISGEIAAQQVIKNHRQKRYESAI